MELHDAVYCDDYDRVESAMTYYIGNVAIRDISIVTAATLGNYDIVELLLHRNVPVETNTMLIAFQRKWETRPIKRMHCQIMHKTSRFTQGWCPKLSAACAAAFYGHKEVLKLLFDNGADMQFNPYASERIPYASERMKAPAWNPLTCALIGEQTEIAKILLRMGVKMTDMKGQVPTLMHILLWQIPRVLVDHLLTYL